MVRASSTPDFWSPRVNGGACSRGLGQLPPRRRRGWRRSRRRAERRGDDPDHAGRCAGPDGHGDHLSFMGAVGGAHLNPAVTLVFAMRRYLPWSPRAGLHRSATSRRGHRGGELLAGDVRDGRILGATTPGQGVSDFEALIMETLLTTGLVSTILGTASGARNIGSNGAIAIGGFIALAGLWAARSAAPR